MGIEDVGMVFQSTSLGPGATDGQTSLPASPANSVTGRSSTGPVRRPIARRANLLVRFVPALHMEKY